MAPPAKGQTRRRQPPPSTPATGGTRKRAQKGIAAWQLLAGLLILVVGWFVSQNHLKGVEERVLGHGHKCKHGHAKPSEAPVSCPVQPDARDLGPDWNPAADKEDSREAYERLAGAIRIRTETFDDMPMDATSERFDIFYEFEAYLAKTFPLFHKHLTLEHVNTHGLLFTWKGKDESLKPIVLMAHQDVVPVNPVTLNQWTHPPFDAHLDEEGWVWGRGTTDMKSTLIALMSATERLLKEKFEPERTILYSMGFDEEIMGQRGAQHLAEVILKRYGPNGVAMIVDEGFTGVDEEYGRTFARVGLGEKGCFTVRLSISTAGGHSSRPPPHTGIGIAGLMFAEMEKNPGPLRLEATNPLLGYLECAATHGNLDEGIKDMVRCPKCWPKLAEQLSKDGTMELFLRTTQAITIVDGGIKYNALPEYVTSLTNYRTSFFEASKDVIGRLVGALSPIAESLNMTFDVLGSHANVENNVIRLETFGRVLEPAPLTPDTGAAWDLFGGTVKHVFPGAVVVPSAMTAFTDTQYYWDVSPHIYRFAPASMKHLLNYHTVNERIHLDAHLSTIRFFYKLIQNTKGWEG